MLVSASKPPADDDRTNPHPDHPGETVPTTPSALPGFLTRAFIANPYATYDYLRRTGPVRRIHRGGTPTWLVTGHDAVRQVLTDQRRFTKERTDWPIPLDQADPGLGAVARFVGDHLLYSDPPRHTRLRGLVSRAFTPRRIAAFEPVIGTVVAHLLDELAARAKADLIGRYAVPISITVICELLGVPAADRRDFRRWSRPLISDDLPGGTGADSGSLAAARKQALDQLTAYLEGLIAAKRADPAGDLLSELVAVRDGEDGRLSGAELVAMALLLLVAGYETTVNVIGNGVLALLDDPAQADLLRREPDRLAAAVDELIRYDGPVMATTLRVTAEPVELAGTRIPAGEIVLAVLGAANRDPARFACPDRLDLTRAPNPHLGFGAGIHYCVGAPLARAQARIAIGALLRRFPAMTLAEPGDRLVWQSSIAVRGLRSLPIFPHGRPAGMESPC
jgi:cytochrome P450